MPDGLFAVKILHQQEFNNEPQFRRELDQLKRFNGFAHEHLVTLLASFTLRQQYHFLFPCADCDLGEYCQRAPDGPVKDLEMVRWFSGQLRGILGALHIIHNPPNITGKYGRHGDLKPDNILWYRCTNNAKGILVITDMGLSSLNRKESRSNIPNRTIPPTPGYRPPECDIEGGTVSRVYDVWTLGCIFMEMVVWFLGGSTWLDKFELERETVVYLTGARSNIFFDIKKVPGPDGVDAYVIQVKPEVTQVGDSPLAPRNGWRGVQGG